MQTISSACFNTSLIFHIMNQISNLLLSTLKIVLPSKYLPLYSNSQKYDNP